MSTHSSFYPVGRMISGSKSGYCNAHPDNVVVFNANLVLENGTKIWHGDLDITLDVDALIEYRNAINKDILILGEHDARFDNEANPRLDRAIAVVTELGVLVK